MNAALNAMPGPVSAPASARAAPSPGAAGEADTGGNGFASALELARTPAKAPPASAAKAAAKSPAKTDVTNDVKTDAAAATVTAAASAAETEPGLEALAPADEAPVADDASGPDLSLLLPGWPEAAALPPPAAVALAPAEPQAASAPPVVAAGPDGSTVAARRERAEPLPAAIELPPTAPPVVGAAPALPSPVAASAQTILATQARPAARTDQAPAARQEAPVSMFEGPGAAPLESPASAPASAPAFAPTFAPALATQVGRLVRDGVQQTPPSQNPAEGVAKHAAIDTSLSTPGTALPAAFTQATALTAPARQGPPPPMFEAHIAAALESPAFAPALATQVSWLVRDGVQQARLSLNPAEMGPVTVRIVLDGTQARVDFSADMIATRAAIETSLPTLAAALHDRGLTLAGGGVSDGQPRSGAQGDRGQQAPGHRGAADSLPQGQASEGRSGTPMRVERGLVDLIA